MGRQMRAIMAMALASTASMLGMGDAGAIELALPLDCAPGQSCWVIHHVDNEPGPGVQDHHCGRLTYDGHDGTDFAIANLRVMQEGVPVLAAAAGTVRGVRDGEPDQRVEERGKEAIRGRECGNGVAIVHGDGLETQYCHLRQGSIAVTAGDEVVAGTRLGLVGLSGETSFPHLHLAVRKDGKSLDPFTGATIGSATCPADGDGALWSRAAADQLAYRPIPITGLGVSPHAPDAAAIRRGEVDATTLKADSAALVVWMQAYKLEADDRIELLLLDPSGAVAHRSEVTQKRAQALVMLWTGPKRRAERWAVGEWRVRATISRGDIRSVEERHIQIEP